jgi:hypothetical protein
LLPAVKTKKTWKGQATVENRTMQEAKEKFTQSLVLWINVSFFFKFDKEMHFLLPLPCRTFIIKE